jgi:hypothetical protein
VDGPLEQVRDRSAVSRVAEAGMVVALTRPEAVPGEDMLVVAIAAGTAAATPEATVLVLRVAVPVGAEPPPPAEAGTRNRRKPPLPGSARSQ